MKILVVRFSSLGDIVLTTPVIRALKLQLDEVEIHFLTKSEYAFLFESNPYVNKTLCLKESLWETAMEIKREQYDLLVDLHHNLRTLVLKTFIPQLKFSSFPKLNLLKWLVVKLKVNKLPNIHIVDRYLAAVKHLGIKKDGQGLDYFIPDKDEIEISWLPETHQKEFVVFAIGGKFSTKRLPVNRMIELCDKINKPVILIGGEEDRKTGEEITQFFEKSDQSEPFEESLEELGKKTLIFNACGKFNINQSASIIKKAKVVFSHDTGMMHIAAAFRKKIFSIWGSTIPEFGMYPYKTSFVIFENKKLDCRPCSKIGFQNCPKGHFKCMNDLVFDFYIP